LVELYREGETAKPFARPHFSSPMARAEK